MHHLKIMHCYLVIFVRRVFLIRIFVDDNAWYLPMAFTCDDYDDNDNGDDDNDDVLETLTVNLLQMLFTLSEKKRNDWYSNVDHF